MIHALAPSPDQTQIAYFKGTPDNLTLCLSRLDGRQPRTLLENLRCSEPFLSLVWSRDSHHLYFAADDDNWFHDIWCVDVRTGQAAQTTDYFHTNSYPLAMHPTDDTLMVISNLRGELNVRLLNTKTSDLRKITDYATPVKTAVYSPTGTEIAYTADASGNPHNSDIYIMNADGFNKRKILSTAAGAFDIVRDWCGTGRYMAVDSNFEGGWRAGVFDLRTGKLKWLTLAWDVAHCCTFSPSGRDLLVYTPDGMRTYQVATLVHQAIAVSGQPAQMAVWLHDDVVIAVTEDDALYHVDLMDDTATPLLT